MDTGLHVKMSKYEKLVFFTSLGLIALMLVTSLIFTYIGIYYNAVNNNTASDFFFQLAVVNFITSFVVFFIFTLIFTRITLGRRPFL